MSTRSILFLCPHGGAKSVIAAACFNRLADEKQLAFAATAVAADEPYAEVPRPVADLLLEREGVDVRAFRPRRVEAADLNDAARAIAIGCAVGGHAVEEWNDVPLVSEDLDGAASAIRRHVAKLAEELRARA